MSFEVYLQCFGDSEATGISRADVRVLFPVNEEESQHDYWRVRYGTEDSCDIDVTPLPSDAAMLGSICIFRPCGDLRFWEALAAVLRMGSVVAFWPGGPPVVADVDVASHLPKDMIISFGQPKAARCGDEILRLLRES